jgi:acetyl esterase/lipase
MAALIPRDRIDPELLPAYDAAGPRDFADLPAFRRSARERVAGRPDPEPAVQRQDRRIPGAPGAPAVDVRVYRPSQTERGSAPALIWAHGGGHMFGSVEEDDDVAARLSAAADCVTVSVEVRLAPEHPYPAAHDDACAGLLWVYTSAAALGIDPRRIAVGGASAGAGLMAGVALRARDELGVPLCHQLLAYPMLDDRPGTGPSPADDDPKVWNRAYNVLAWRHYLGPGDEPAPIYAAPARAAVLDGLPPATLIVGDLDLFLAEDLDYARRLMDAGVPVGLSVYPGAFHGFYRSAPEAAVSSRFYSDATWALRRWFRAGETL